MAQPRVLILRAPGSNCDQETAFAFEKAGGAATVWHINRLLESPQSLDDFQILCVPGGFSYGDDIAAGKIFADQFQLRLKDALFKFRSQQKLILGVCNGFQVLLKAGLFQDAQDSTPPDTTLTWNENGLYEDRWVHLRVDPGPSVWLQGLERLELPIAHAEGKFVAKEPSAIHRLFSRSQAVLRYTSPHKIQTGKLKSDPEVQALNEGNLDFPFTPLPYPSNPNGSQGDIAGLCDPSGTVLGLMPHPERYIDFTHHPRWTRMPNHRKGEGLKIFHNGVEAFH
ncbi:Phosphoribosylformylglycinamidine synthase subunit PurQ [Planctomycetales bacterium 10988]|nr:Phosphoribosylformylglycinamidine synthase subunit PurQ [Planctomycetales bacterium 10988]